MIPTRNKTIALTKPNGNHSIFKIRFILLDVFVYSSHWETDFFITLLPKGAKRSLDNLKQINANGYHTTVKSKITHNTQKNNHHNQPKAKR